MDTDQSQNFEAEAKLVEEILVAASKGLTAELDHLLFRKNGNQILGVCRDEAGRTPLHLAAANGHYECVESLLQAGHAWNAVDDEYKSAGEMAQEAGHKDIYECLISAGCRTELILGLLQSQGQLDDDDDEDDESGGVVPQEKVSNSDYLEMPLTYSEDHTKLLDAEKNAVMMDWEGPLMKKHAEVLCPRPGLSVLNVGFGLGLIDDALQSFSPASHTIIEAHPDVYAHMIKLGWDQKPGVKILFGRWQDMLKEGRLETYDGIFWDTFGEHYHDQRVFQEEIPNLLNPGGIYSFFNGLGGTNLFFHDVYCRIVEMEFQEMGCTVEYIPIEIDPKESQIWDGVKRRYWSLKKYNLPIIRTISY